MGARASRKVGSRLQVGTRRKFPVGFARGGSHLPTKSIYRPHDLLTKAEAAEEFRVTERYLKWLHDQRRVRSYIIANRIRFRWLDLYDFLESQAKEASR